MNENPSSTHEAIRIADFDSFVDSTDGFICGAAFKSQGFKSSK
jgi:hypothetical protein